METTAKFKYSAIDGVIEFKGSEQFILKCHKELMTAVKQNCIELKGKGFSNDELAAEIAGLKATLKAFSGS